MDARGDSLRTMGIDRWLLRRRTESTAETAEPEVQWLFQSQNAIVTVLMCSPLDPQSGAVLEKMLGAIGLARDDCDLGVMSVPGVLEEGLTRPVLALAENNQETAWQSAVSSCHVNVEIVPHPARFAADPALKRPAWEAMKRLKRVLDGD